MGSIRGHSGGRRHVHRGPAQSDRHHGVPVVEAEQVVHGLLGRGVPVEYVLFPDEGHGFRKEANRARAVAAVVGWFERALSAR